MPINTLVLAQDPGAANTLIRNAPGFVNAIALGVATAEDVNVPGPGLKVLFSSDGVFYVNTQVTATVPGDTTDGTASEMNPTGYILGSITKFSLISPAACIVTMAFYQ